MLTLVNRHEFTAMLQTLVDVTAVCHKHVDITEPVCFVGFASQYRMGNRLLAEELHTTNGSIYYIDTEWEIAHVKKYMSPDQISMGCDDRGWYFDMFKLSHKDYPESDCIRILAGCRNLSLEEAKKHWADNPEVYPRILMAEQIAIHRGWLPIPEDGPHVDAGELACEKAPTIPIPFDRDLMLVGIKDEPVDVLEYEREVTEYK